MESEEMLFIAIQILIRLHAPIQQYLSKVMGSRGRSPWKLCKFVKFGSEEHSTYDLVWTLHTPVWTIHTGVWTLHTLVWTLHARVWTVNTQVWTLHTRVWIVHTSVWIVHTSPKTPVLKRYTQKFQKNM